MRRLAIAAVLFAAACGAQPEAEAQFQHDTTHEQLKQDAVDETIRVMGQEGVTVEINGTPDDTTNAGFGGVFGLRKKVCDDDGTCRFIEPTDAELKKMRAQADNRVAELVNAYSGINCHGITKQGGMVICQTAPNARVEIGRAEDDTYTQTADSNGIIIIGFDRDEPAAFARVGQHRVNFTIEPRAYDTSRINGLPSNMVNEYTEAELKRIRAATARKKVGFASKATEIGFKDGFIYPVADHIKTTNFGAQRILNGEPKRPHFGVDLAAPKGTPILAPADGIVSMADDDMYFEGSLILIDHGQGLISYYLHNEDVMVTEGQRVRQGEQIGTVGSRGRSTGPHLCWRLKWRGRNLDPELLTQWPKG